MFTGFDKAIAAFLVALLGVLTANGIDVPTWITADWLGAAVSVIATPVAVYLVANK